VRHGHRRRERRSAGRSGMCRSGAAGLVPRRLEWLQANPSQRRTPHDADSRFVRRGPWCCRRLHPKLSRRASSAL